MKNERMKVLVLLLFLVQFSFCASGQVRYSFRVEMGGLLYDHRTHDVNPGENWKGYSLEHEQDGISIDMLNGISLKNKLFVGVGVGYLNFEGIHGYSIFGDVQYLPMKTKLTPLIGMKIGSDRIWNQYEGGQQSGLLEFSAGVSYRLNEKVSIYLSSGIFYTQQAALIPIRIGVRIR